MSINKKPRLSPITLQLSYEPDIALSIMNWLEGIERRLIIPKNLS